MKFDTLNSIWNEFLMDFDYMSGSLWQHNKKCEGETRNDNEYVIFVMGIKIKVEINLPVDGKIHPQ